MAVSLLGYYEVCQTHRLKYSQSPYWRRLIFLTMRANLRKFLTDQYRSRKTSAQHFKGVAAIVEQRRGTGMSSDMVKRILLAVRGNIVRPNQFQSS